MKGWKALTLGEVMQLEYGKPLASEDRNPFGLYPAYGANGEKDRTDRFYRDQPSIIVGRKGSAGEITLTEEKYWPLDVTYFADFDRERHDLRFLYYLLTRLDLPSLAKGVKPGINRNEVYAIPVMVPPLPEQLRIVAILDEAFEGIAIAKANAEKNLRNARELFDSHLEAVLAQGGDGWLNAPIFECFKVRSGDFLPAKNMDSEGDVPVYGGNGIAGSHSASNLSGDQIVIGRVGAKCGNVRHVAGAIWLTDNAFHISKFLRPFDPAFLARVLNLKNLRRTANQAAQPVISYTTIKDVVLSFPVDVAVQRGIALRLDELEQHVEHVEAIFKHKLATLDELKKSLLQQAFSGAL